MFSRWRNTRFQTKLLLIFILLSSIPTLFIGVTAYQKSSQLLKDQNEQDLKVILSQLNTSIERQIKDFDRFSMLPYYLPHIFSFLNQPAVSPEEWGTAEIEAQKTMVRLMSAYPSIHSSISGLMIYGMNGTVNGYRLSGNMNINTDISVTNENWYSRTIEGSGSFIVSGLEEIHQFSGTPFHSIIGARLLRDEDYQTLAVIAFFISPDFIPKIISSLDIPDLQVTVMDKDQKLIYTSNPDLADQLIRAEVSEQGLWEANVNQKVYSGVYEQSNYLDWTIFMGTDRNVVLAGSKTIRNYTIIVMTMVGIAAALISWLLARGLSQPISRLIHSMREVERGNFSTSIKTDRFDEIGMLEISYRKMVERIEDLIRSIEEKERQKRRAELHALQARIQPHFLYNTLNSIRMLAIIQGSEQISKLIQHLNKLLQANMKLDTELVTLAEEIHLLKHYVALMELRYTDMFEVEWQIPDSISHALVPSMILQPILENSIFHGSKSLNHKLKIVVSAYLNEERDVCIKVVDNGVGFANEAVARLYEEEVNENSKHIGLRNIHDRIRLRFGIRYGLLYDGSPGNVTVTLIFPFIPTHEECNDNVEFTGR